MGREFDLAITANHSGGLHRLRAPVVIVSHGVGYCKRAPHGPEYGISPQSLLHKGKLVADTLVFTHQEQVARLAATVPQALPAACYAAALDKPVALAAFDEHEIVDGTAVSTMVELAGQLDRHAPLLPQLAAANAKCPRRKGSRQLAPRRGRQPAPITVLPAVLADPLGRGAGGADAAVAVQADQRRTTGGAGGREVLIGRGVHAWPGSAARRGRRPSGPGRPAG